MKDRDLLIGLALLFCIALSFLFSGMESGVLALNHFRIRQLARAGDRRARVLHGCLENPEDFLWTILVGNTVVNFLIFSVALVKLRDWLHVRPVLWLLVVAAAVFVFYIVCELVPKTLFLRHPTRLTLALARPFRAIHGLLAPLVALVAWFSRGLLRYTGGKTFTGRLFGSREELRFVMQESAPNLTTEEKAMINRVLDLQNLRVRHVTIPMAAAATVTASAPMSQALALCRERNFNRIPVLDTKTGQAAGVINLEWLLYSGKVDPSKPAREYMEPAFFLPEELRLEEALRRMQATGCRLGIVFSADHGETGLISLQDILRVIFGEVNL
ncbi:MAG: CNNM domain-containing protein [Verrucomicrobiota bacterium]|jgi:CBS domain containing-hemolysin-like protein